LAISVSSRVLVALADDHRRRCSSTASSNRFTSPNGPCVYQAIQEQAGTVTSQHCWQHNSSTVVLVTELQELQGSRKPVPQHYAISAVLPAT
jgi:hypothetical protein